MIKECPKCKEEPYIKCPFCHEPNFDLIGLKLHLEHGDCDKYNSLPELIRI
jgi:hypothetical protein